MLTSKLISKQYCNIKEHLKEKMLRLTICKKNHITPKHKLVERELLK